MHRRRQTQGRTTISIGNSLRIAEDPSASGSRLDRTFRRLKARQEKALITYLMAGDPSLAETEQLVLAANREGDAKVAAAIRQDSEFRARGYVLKVRGQLIF